VFACIMKEPKPQMVMHAMYRIKGQQIVFCLYCANPKAVNKT
jgi:hypothetical protein